VTREVFGSISGFSVSHESMAQGDPYELLGLTSECSHAQIKESYRLLAQRIHPDKNLSDPNAPEAFRILHEAYKLLSDPEKRQEHDRMARSDFAPEFAERVPLSEFTKVSNDDDDDGGGGSGGGGDDFVEYERPCRCGGSHIVSDGDVAEGPVTVQCCGCSIWIVADPT